MGDALPSSFFNAVSISATSPAIESNAVVSGRAADTLATDASSELTGWSDGWLAPCCSLTTAAYCAAPIVGTNLRGEIAG